MKKVFPLALVILVIALATTVAVQSQRTQVAVAAANAALAQARARVSELEGELARLRSAEESYQSEAEALRARLTVKSTESGTDGAARGGTSEIDAAAKVEAKTAASPMGQLAKMFKDPEMKKVMRTQQSMGIRMMYGELSVELGLSPNDADALNELLTDRQLAMSEQGMQMMSGGADEKKLPELTEATNKRREEYDKQLADMLGEGGLEKFQQYERSMGDRMMLRQFQDQFASRGTPLQEDQRKQLLGIMSDERTKAPASPFDPGSRDVANQLKAMQSDEMMDKQFDQQRQVNARVLTRASGILSPEQVNSLRTSQDQMLEMQKMGMKMSRQMFQQQQPAAPADVK